jgi:hypothetical protein
MLSKRALRLPAVSRLLLGVNAPATLLLSVILLPFYDTVTLRSAYVLPGRVLLIFFSSADFYTQIFVPHSRSNLGITITSSLSRYDARLTFIRWLNAQPAYSKDVCLATAPQYILKALQPRS